MNRREVVKLGILTACVGCGGGGGDEPTPDAFAGTGSEMCGANLCLDLTHPANAALLNVDGARTLNITGDKIIIIRETATTFAVLSRICTHNGCGLAYNKTITQLTCSCHGSRFALDGSVTRDPAIRSLRTYANTFDDPTQTLTILLG